MTDEEWEAAKDKLVEDCPILFRPGPTPGHSRGAKRGSTFYFEISRGWHGPVRKACLALEKIAEKYPEPPDPYGEEPDLRPHARQIKEKFGGLRFYTNGSHEESGPILDQAEAECWKTCERCGEPGELRRDLGWLRTLCDTHHVEAGRAERQG